MKNPFKYLLTRNSKKLPEICMQIQGFRAEIKLVKESPLNTLSNIKQAHFEPLNIIETDHYFELSIFNTGEDSLSDLYPSTTPTKPIKTLILAYTNANNLNIHNIGGLITTDIHYPWKDIYIKNIYLDDKVLRLKPRGTSPPSLEIRINGKKSYCYFNHVIASRPL